MSEYWSWRDWSRELASHFFGEFAAGEPVLFLVDEQALAAIFDRGDAEDAVDSLALAVRSQLTPKRPGGLYSGIESEAHRWRREVDPGDPPFLPLLAAGVLAATRMSSDSSDKSYRRPYCELLGIPTSAMYPDIEVMPVLWGYLAWWLDEHLAGARGFSTFVRHESWTLIGYALSQTLFLASDEAKLADFFRWLDLDPGESVEANYLLAHFRVWAPGNGLSEGAMKMLEREEFRPTLERIIAGHAERWDGTNVPGSQQREARLKIRVTAFPRVAVELIAPRGDGFPQVLSWRVGTLMGELSAVSDDWYGRVDMEVTSALLEDGVQLTDGEWGLRLVGSDIHPLRLDNEAGGWASVSSIEVGERHWLLVSEQRWERVARAVRRIGGEDVADVSAPGLPGWRLVKEFVPSSKASDADIPELGTAAPTVSNRLALEGGLPLEVRGTYLLGGAPNLWRPDAGETGAMAVSVSQAGQTRDLPDQAVTRLSDLEPPLDDGAVELSLDGEPFRIFHLMESRRERPPEPRGVSDGVRGEALVVEDGQGYLRGAVLEGAEDLRPAPVLLNPRARRWSIFGRRPGELEAVRAPAEPGSWFTQLGLNARRFEYSASFEVLWVIETFDADPRRRARLCSSAGIACNPMEDEEAVLAWAGRLSVPAIVLDRDREAWEETQALAAGLINR